MRRNLISIASVLVLLTTAACGSRINPSDFENNTEVDEGDDSSGESAGIRESVIPTTGGMASSEDGIFSVLLGPFVFSETITMKIEKLEELPLGEEQSLSATYRVTYEPAEAAPSLRR